MTALNIHKTYRDPHFCFHVRTNDQKVLELLESYLNFRHTEKKFSPFFEITYHVHYRDRDTLSRKDKAIYSISKAGDDELSAMLSEKVADVKANVRTMEVSADLFSLRHDIGVMDFVFLQPCRLFLACHDWVYLHGAHVQSATHDFIFTGSSGAGKSSLAYTLGMHADYCLQSDDEVYIHTDTKHNFCLPFPTRIGFKNKALEESLGDHPPEETLYGNKRRFCLPISDKNFRDIDARKTVILVPYYDEKVTSLTLDPLKVRDIYEEIILFAIPMCNIHYWKKEEQQAWFNSLTFVKRSEIYRLTYNDRLLKDVPALIANRPPPTL